MSDTSSKTSAGAVIKQSFAYTLSTWAGRFFSIISTPILTRILTPEDYGIVDFIATLEIAGFLIISAGIDAGFRRYYIDAQKEEDRHAYLGTGYIAWLFLNLILVSLLFFGAEWVATVLLGDVSLTSITRVAAIATLGSSLVRMSSELLRDNMEVRSVVVTSVINISVRLLLSVVFVASLGTGVVGLYYATIIATTIAFIGQVFLGRHFLGFSFSWRKLGKMVRFGLPLLPANVATYLIQYSDRYFINIFLGLSPLGLYAVGNKVANLTIILTSGFVTAWGPYVLNIYRQPDSHKIFKRVFRVYTAALTLVTVGLSVFAVELLLIFTTVEYVDSYIFIPYLAYSLLLYGIGYYFSFGIDITEKTFQRTWIGGIVIVLNPVLNIVLIPELGLVGAAIATLISYIAYCYTSLLVSERIYPIGFAIGRFTLLQMIGALVIMLSFMLQEIGVSLEQIIWKSILMLGTCIVPFLIGLVNFHEFSMTMQALWHRLRRKGAIRPVPASNED